MNVVWFCVDTLRADHLSCYGYFRKTSPNIDRLAAEGVLFPGSRANAIATGPAFTSMFTARYAINNEWYETPWDAPDMINFPDAKSVFPERIWDQGDITTAAFDNLFSFPSHMKQFVRGFEYYVNATGTSQPVFYATRAGDVNRRLLPWIRGHKDERFFLFVHYWDPHVPYNQPDDFARPFVHKRGTLDDLEIRQAPAGYRYVPGWGTVEQIPGTEGPVDFKADPKWFSMHPESIDSYDGEVHYTDHCIGEVIAELDDVGILDQTAIIINADHGEQMNQHLGTWDHRGLHDSVVFTPLVIRCPGLLPKGARPAGYVLHIDIGPTILDLLGIKSADVMDGMSLLPLIRGKAKLRDHYFTETMTMRAVVRDNWKYIWHRFAPDELYNLEADPMEMVNLVSEEHKRKENLQTELFEWVKKNLAGRPDPSLSQFARALTIRGPQWDTFV